MSTKVSHFPLQRFVRALPKPLRRIKVAQVLAALTGSRYHRVQFQQGELIGNVQDCSLANCLVQGAFADYGYFEMADRILCEGDFHADLGANYGFHTFGLLPSPIKARIKYVLMDANPDCVFCLNESAKLHPGLQFQIFHGAAAAKAGELKFSFAPSSTVNGHVGAAQEAGGIEVTVPAAPLDDLFAQNGIDKIGLLKMDIEGSEPFAMEGLQKMLSSHRVDCVYFEVNPSCLKLQQTSPKALFETFTRHGYRLFWPHDGVDWILKTYGRDNATAADLKMFTLLRNKPHSVCGFDEARYREDDFGQCDLLAVSPRCRVDG